MRTDELRTRFLEIVGENARQGNVTSLDAVSEELEVSYPLVREARRYWAEQGLVTIQARFTQLTPEGRVYLGLE